MVDEMKAFNLLSEMVIEIRELRKSVTIMIKEKIDLERQVKDLQNELENMERVIDDEKNKDCEAKEGP